MHSSELRVVEQGRPKKRSMAWRITGMRVHPPTSSRLLICCKSEMPAERSRKNEYCELATATPGCHHTTTAATTIARLRQPAAKAPSPARSSHILSLVLSDAMQPWWPAIAPPKDNGAPARSHSFLHAMYRPASETTRRASASRRGSSGVTIASMSARLTGTWKSLSKIFSTLKEAIGPALSTFLTF